MANSISKGSPTVGRLRSVNFRSTMPASRLALTAATISPCPALGGLGRAAFDDAEALSESPKPQPPSERLAAIVMDPSATATQRAGRLPAPLTRVNIRIAPTSYPPGCVWTIHRHANRKHVRCLIWDRDLRRYVAVCSHIGISSREQ